MNTASPYQPATTGFWLAVAIGFALAGSIASADPLYFPVGTNAVGLECGSCTARHKRLQQDMKRGASIGTLAVATEAKSDPDDRATGAVGDHRHSDQIVHPE